ncbi:phosphoribosylformylglycinamidine cyclo-ligase [bacterium]|nr:phosphoribosylformylglycinamidine cyclo-ligase [candidate division CSSED10-310 bacterium]
MKGRKRLTYRAAGVDIERGDDFVRRILPFAKSTRTHSSIDDIGAFAGMIDLAPGNWKDPILVACTDGVGTKLKLAFEIGRHDTIGIDLVAMSINDLLVTGAEPLAFLDYLATSQVDLNVHPEIVKGIAEGCIQGGCALIGGETAELPGFYTPGEYDLAGFAVGIVERGKILSPTAVAPGDLLIGLPSTGIHSNGYSLVRKVFEDRRRYPLEKPLPGFTVPLGDILLMPTRIYRPEFALLRTMDGLKSAAHITGSGIPGNLPRAIPDHLGVSVRHGSWPIPAIFDAIRSAGSVLETEMYQTFNMGLGMVLVISPDYEASIRSALQDQGFETFIVGNVVDKPGFHWTRSDRPTQSQPANPGQKSSERRSPPRLAILGSGRGSNMESICRAIDSNNFQAEVVCVVSNNSKAMILERARERKIPAFHVSSLSHPGSETDALLDIFQRCKADTLVLAGYMKKLPEEIVRHFQGRSFNIHPALLPSFGGIGMYGHHVHEAVISSGAKFSGVTVHEIGVEYDRGKILGQRVVPVLPEDNPDSLASRVLREEHDLYWRVLKRHLTTAHE